MERGCVIPMDTVEEIVNLAIPSPSISENDLSEEVERKHKETKRKRQILAFVIICVLIVGGVIVNLVKS
jgi:hypothetical protein